MSESVRQTTGHATRSEAATEAPPLRPTDLVGALSALVAEGCLISAHMLEVLTLPVALVGHLAVSALLIGRYMLLVRRGRDGTASLLLAFVVLAAGPFGAIGGVLIGRLSRPEAADVARLAAWYERISLSTDLSETTRRSDRILTGRIANLKADVPRSFAGVLEHGNIRDQQTVLSLIARRFHPDYLAALKLALTSEEPVIRVQAAAVAAKIRVDLATRADAALAAAANPKLTSDAALRHLADAENYARSGLMEEPDKQRTLSAVETFLAAAADSFDRNPRLIESASAGAPLDRYETRLLVDKRYGDFRRLRRARAWNARTGTAGLRLRIRIIPKRAKAARLRAQGMLGQGAAE